MSNIRIVDLNGGDLGRASVVVSGREETVTAAIKLGIEELKHADVPDSHKRSEALCYSVEIHKTGMGLLSDKELEALMKKLDDGDNFPVWFYQDPACGDRVFPIYGASGGRAAACIVYLIRPACGSHRPNIPEIFKKSA